MDEISATAAKKNHNISAFHNNLPNGEKRFRLKKNDGTAYIRTESGIHGAWQESHFHNRVLETYIVQTGWIGYAEEVNGEVRLSIYRQGKVFTTKPGTVHNVYMSGNSVIHTVKHGDCSEDDRNTFGTAKFDAECKLLDTEEKIRTAAFIESSEKPQDEVTYGEEYQHFDKLIWQAPAWASAVFALAIGSLGSENLSRFSTSSSISRSSLEFLFLAIVSLTLFCFSYVMFRFRLHQIRLKKYDSTPFIFSASSLTQLAMNVQATFFFSIALAVVGIPLKVLWVAAPLFVIFVSWLGHKELNRQRQQKLLS